jgi:hypothetical protein
MPWPSSISNPVPSTVITVAYAIANILDPIRWLRQLTGGSDPPGSDYVVRSTSTTATSWSKVVTDMIANLTVTNEKLANNNIDLSTKAADGSLTGGKVATQTIHGDTKTIPGTVTGQHAGSAIPAGGVHANRIQGSSFDAAHVNAAFTDGSINGATKLVEGSVPYNKLAATPGAYGAASPFAVTTSSNQVVSTNVPVAGTYEISVTFMIRCVANSAVNDANVAFTCDVFKQSGPFGPQLRKYFPPVASAPGEGYDSQEYWMHVTFRQALGTNEPLALNVSKSGGSGGTRCEHAIISAIRVSA